MWDRLVEGPLLDGNGPASKAVGEWNSILNGIGPQLQIVGVDCGTSYDCIKVEETDDTIDGCADFNWA